MATLLQLDMVEQFSGIAPEENRQGPRFYTQTCRLHLPLYLYSHVYHPAFFTIQRLNLTFNYRSVTQPSGSSKTNETYIGEEPPQELNTTSPKKPSPEPTSLLLDNQRLGRMWIKGVIIAVIFFLLLPLISFEREIQRICARHGTGVSSYCGDQSMVGKMFASLAFAAVNVVLDVAFDRYNQFFQRRNFEMETYQWHQVILFCSVMFRYKDCI